MCGIAGFLSPGGQALALPFVEGLLEGIRHRGPDGSGWLACQREGIHQNPGPWPEGGVQVLLLHRRLSILDLTEAGSQPMAYAHGRLQVVFNGEIYNFLELRAELEGKGHVFRTRSDTEVLLAAYLAWGVAAFRRLVGMFAVALLDQEARKVVLVRDGFGIKPLYLAHWRDGLVFGSELRSLLAFPGLAREVDPQALCSFLRSNLTDSGSATLYRGISQLPPGHFLEVDLDRPMAPPEPRPFWMPTLGEPLHLTRNQAAEELRDRFVESVKLHLRSDVPVGSALSGGIDSSAIVMAMRRLEPGLDLHTFTYEAEDPSVDESRWATLVAREASAIPHRVRVGHEEVIADLDALIRVQEQPFGTFSIYAQNRVFRLAAEHGIKVMLDGQGADEMLGGYIPYSGARLASMLRRGEWSRALSFYRRASLLPGRGRLAQYLGQFLLPPSLQAPFRAAVGESEWKPWMKRSWFQDHGACPAPRYLYTRDPAVLHHQLLKTITETSLPMLLRFEDRNSMAYSVESRVPFLTSSLADFVLRLPEEYLIDDEGTTKSIFRQAMRGLVPDPILDRKDKIGFETPGLVWAQALDPWVRARIHEAMDRQVQSLDLVRVLQEWEGVVSGRRPFGNHVWRWVNVLAWASVFEVAL